ncbi:hypothetical protein JG687_00013805 [Phytophthora cactorum]|uniref:Lipase-like C-terminal domain-containing protein n=2 Tax=Phytophthora cactorum TaxID=29920 RepID=A0A329S112_9STRA|nr:hypothetical protein Pcac1_g26946 [Phytophthora cactorum]KAG2814268.1 hypothetical protein PC112_g14391 [Phytophthora cactorum]KAG2817816.1 hypothetical protein PC111_g12546 [Phytophthora cactorum]KAG2852954.1 hypothetical protein PC113_g14590 [Phytophthora cactorum]KAG2894872.1 hypothetical protein PC114_g15710 [Phytophthora cactorum]
MTSTSTKYPVVLIHGVFGYGKTRPLWNSWSSYWPEEALNKLNKNHLMVDVGALSSDHDRACEAFYQLYGGQVDYGETHSREAGHNRFGDTHETPLHPHWSASNPVHLVGHSFGATTALELYQLISSDFFGIGSDHRWVVSLISIAGPLSGSTITHLFGLHDLHMVPYSLGHFVGAALGLWFKLQTDYSVLRQVFDFNMPQWRCVDTFREILSPYGRINGSTDLAVFNLLPRERMKRNARLIHMDKIFLVSVATSSHVTMPRVEITLIVLVLGFAFAAVIGRHTVLSTLVLFALIPALRRRVRALDYASIPSLYALLLVMRRHVRTLHMIFDGFDRELWGNNDGAVNLHSMLQPWASKVSSESDTESTASTSSSLSLEADLTTASTTQKASVDLHRDEINPSDPTTDPLDLSELRRGTWYVHRVEKNHMAGTHFDSDSPELFQRLFRVLADQFETRESLDFLEKKKRGQAEACLRAQNLFL